MTELRCPVKVAIIDLARPLRDLDCTRPSGPPYTAAWILVCRDGCAIGGVTIPLTGTVITAAELDNEVSHQLRKARAGTSEANMPALPRATVVIPTNFARPDQLRRCVEQLTKLDYPDYEIIVVDNRPGKARQTDIPGARVVHEPRPGISAARNRGIVAATGDVVAFTDDDVVVDHRWLRALGERFVREPDVAAVTGLVAPLVLETQAQVLFEQSGNGLDRCFERLTFEQVSRFKVSRRAHAGKTEQVRSIYMTGEFGTGSNMAFRKEKLLAVGGFDEALGVGTPTCGGEDLAMLLEVLTTGNRLGYEPSAIIQHSHRETFAELEQQIKGYGIGFTALLTSITWRNPRHALGLTTIIPEWLLSLRDPSSAKNANRTQDYPRALARAELLGMLRGPFAYLRSRRFQKRWIQ